MEVLNRSHRAEEHKTELKNKSIPSSESQENGVT